MIQNIIIAFLFTDNHRVNKSAIAAFEKNNTIIQEQFMLSPIQIIPRDYSLAYVKTSLGLRLKQTRVSAAVLKFLLINSESLNLWNL